MSDATKAAEIIQRANRSEPVTDAEVEHVLRTLEPSVDMLGALGPIYHLAWAELHGTFRRFEGFKRMRESVDHG